MEPKVTFKDLKKLMILEVILRFLWALKSVKAHMRPDDKGLFDPPALWILWDWKVTLIYLVTT